jgi:ELWxxDGT repeat protein
MSTPRLVADIRPGISSSNPRHLTAIGNILYFSANDGVSGYELWKTDGTSSGTTQVSDIHPGISNSYPGSLTAIGNTIYFGANDGIRGFELWKTDGTRDGTSLVADINPDSSGYGVSRLAAVGNTLYFIANDQISGYELWKTDGTTTTLVADINPGIANSYPRKLTVVGDTLFFTASDGRRRDLWRADGTNTGISRLTDFGPLPLFPSSIARWNPQSLTRVGNTLFFVGPGESNEFALWKSDGIPSGTNRIIDFQLGVFEFDALQLAALGETLFFTAFDATSGSELWKTDGTALGTQLVADIWQGPDSSRVRQLTAVGNTLFFTANDGISGTELWKTDGTSAGTKRVADINPGIRGSYPDNLTPVGNSLFFTAFDRSNGHELWRTDGTASGTIRITNTSSVFSASPAYPTLVGNTLFFTAELDNNGNELWALDVSDVVGDPNIGPASFEISGSLRSGNYLSASLKTSDPDGNGPFTYTWQTSSDGNTWANVGSNRPSYRISTSDAGKQLRLVATYRDGKGNFETVTTVAGTVAFTPSHEVLEILAKDVIYQASHTLGSLIPEIAGLPYVINRIWDDSSTGLYALGLSAPDAPSVLVFRGTGDKLDIWDDLNPNGIGYDQFTSNYDQIRNWLFDQDSSLAPIITGHSLGGALAQWTAADATANGRMRLAKVVTFNSPGIAAVQSHQGKSIGANAFNSSLVGEVTHYITSTDIVSLGGSQYVPGQFKLFDYSSLPDPGIGQHLNPVLVPQLPISGKDRAGDFTLSSKPFWFLNSPLFNYNTDIDFVILRLTLAGIAKASLALGGVGAIVGNIINSLNKALRSRFDTENLRQTLGTVLNIPGVKPALDAAMSFASVAAETASERVQSAFAAITKSGRDALNAIASFSDDLWDQISSATAANWNSLSNWTSNAWRDSVEWTQDTWQTLLSPAFDFSKPFIITAAKRLFFLPAAVPLLRMEAASLEPSYDSNPLSGTAMFSMATFSAQASYQTIDVPIALSQPSTEIITLNFETVDGTAVAGVDYISRSGSLQFEPGETEKIVTIELLAPDGLATEKDFKVRVNNLLNAQFLTSEEITVVFKPNVPPVVALPPADQFAPIDEPLFFALPPDTFSDGNSPDGDSLQYTALLANGNPLPAWLSFDPATQTFSGSPPAAALGIFDIEITATDASQGSATASFSLNIVAYDGPAVFSITGTPGVGQTLTAARSEDDPDGNGTDPIYIWQASSDGRSWRTIGADSSRYIITASDAGQDLRLQIAYTDGEGFNEFLQIPAGFVPLHPTLTITPLTADKEEGNADTTNFTFRVTRSGDLAAESTSRWTVTGSGDNPADAADFLNGRFPSGTVRFLAGKSARNITVRVAGDTTFEADETFTVSLSDPAGASINPAFSTAIGTIRNDDAPPLPELAIAPFSADKEEGNADTTNFTFRVTRSGDLDAESAARWTVAGSGDNPADAADFLNGRFPSGTVRFLAGKSARNITVRVAGDTTFEADETFTVSLSDPAGASINPAFTSATGTIRNDDAPPLPELAIAATDANKPEGFSGNTPFTFTVTRSGNNSGISIVNWAVNGIGASPADAADFARGVLPSGTVRFRPGDTSRTITVNVRADRDQEPDERFRVTLSNPTDATITTARATGIIRNDDLIGTAANDTIIGTRRPELIDGLAGQDTLTGGAGPDVFGFRFGQSRIRTPDRITDFRFGEDTIALLNAQGQLRAAPVAFSRAANNSTAATLADLAAAVFADADGRTAGDQPLAANAAALVRSTNAAIAGNYLLINNGNAGRSLTTDLMVNITGFSGTLPALGVRPVESVFA